MRILYCRCKGLTNGNSLNVKDPLVGNNHDLHTLCEIVDFCEKLGCYGLLNKAIVPLEIGKWLLSKLCPQTCVFEGRLCFFSSFLMVTMHLRLHYMTGAFDTKNVHYSVSFY